jgi:cyanophycinase
MDGGALTPSYLRLGIVGAGYTFNLRARELETLLMARSANTATEVLRGDGAAG